MDTSEDQIDVPTDGQDPSEAQSRLDSALALLSMSVEQEESDEELESSQQAQQQLEEPTQPLQHEQSVDNTELEPQQLSQSSQLSQPPQPSQPSESSQQEQTKVDNKKSLQIVPTSATTTTKPKLDVMKSPDIKKHQTSIKDFVISKKDSQEKFSKPEVKVMAKSKSSPLPKKSPGKSQSIEKFFVKSPVSGKVSLEVKTTVLAPEILLQPQSSESMEVKIPAPALEVALQPQSSEPMEVPETEPTTQEGPKTIVEPEPQLPSDDELFKKPLHPVRRRSWNSPRVRIASTSSSSSSEYEIPLDAGPKKYHPPKRYELVERASLRYQTVESMADLTPKIFQQLVNLSRLIPSMDFRRFTPHHRINIERFVHAVREKNKTFQNILEAQKQTRLAEASALRSRPPPLDAASTSSKETFPLKIEPQDQKKVLETEIRRFLQQFLILERFDGENTFKNIYDSLELKILLRMKKYEDILRLVKILHQDSVLTKPIAEKICEQFRIVELKKSPLIAPVIYRALDKESFAENVPLSFRSNRVEKLITRIEKFSKCDEFLRSRFPKFYTEIRSKIEEDVDENGGSLETVRKRLFEDIKRTLKDVESSKECDLEEHRRIVEQRDQKILARIDEIQKQIATLKTRIAEDERKSQMKVSFQSRQLQLRQALMSKIQKDKGTGRVKMQRELKKLRAQHSRLKIQLSNSAAAVKNEKNILKIYGPLRRYRARQERVVKANLKKKERIKSICPVVVRPAPQGEDAKSPQDLKRLIDQKILHLKEKLKKQKKLKEILIKKNEGWNSTLEESETSMEEQVREMPKEDEDVRVVQQRMGELQLEEVKKLPQESQEELPETSPESRIEEMTANFAENVEEDAFKYSLLKAALPYNPYLLPGLAPKGARFQRCSAFNPDRMRPIHHPCVHQTMFKKFCHFKNLFNTNHLYAMLGGNLWEQRNKLVFCYGKTCRGIKREALHICLTCACFTCYDIGHAHSHFRQSRHIFAMSVVSGYIYCFLCKRYVFDFDFDPTVKMVRHMFLPQANATLIRKWDTLWAQYANGEFYPGERMFKLDFSHSLAGLRGFLNLGNTCSMSSVLQPVIHSPIFREHLLLEKHECSRDRFESCIACELNHVAYQIYSGEAFPFIASRFFELIWKNIEFLAGYQQQDAHEFLILLLDLLHEQYKGDGSAQQDASQCECIIHRLFNGFVQSELTCLTCSSKRTTDDPNLGFSLDLKNHHAGASDQGCLTSLEECLRVFTQVEDLGDIRLTCPQCGTPQHTTKQMTIKHAPPIVTFHFKRFEHVMSLQQSTKIDEKISYPIDIDITPYILSGEKCSHLYTLFGVVNHIGTLDTGHYTFSYRNDDGSWIKFNDHIVSRTTEEIVLNDDAYILFYHRRDLTVRKQPKKKRKILEDMELN